MKVCHQAFASSGRALAVTSVEPNRPAIPYARRLGSRFLLFGLACYALVVASVRGAETGLPTPTIPSGFGVNIHFTDPAKGEMDRFAQAGYRWVRMDLAWGHVERTKGQYDFSAYDRLLAHLKKANARALLILDYANPHYDDGVAPHTDTGRAAFSRFASAAAAHFRGQGVLWEIWNEPNLAQFWKPAPSAEAYAKLAVATARAIRAADPDAVILAPGSSQFPWDFFENTFRAGLLEHIDAVSVHPYRETAPETAADDFGKLHVLIARYAPSAKRSLPVVSSEWGYSTAKGAVSEARQAQYLVRMWLANLVAGVPLSIFYDWRDDGDNPDDREHRFGTVRRNFEPKPSFEAARSLISSLDGYSLRHRLQGKHPDDWRLLFQKGDSDALALVVWNAAPSAADAEQTPRVQPVAPSAAEFADLRRLSSVRLEPRTLVEDRGHPAALGIYTANFEAHPVRVAIVPDGKEPVVVHETDAGGHSSSHIELPVAPIRAERRSVDLRIRWNDRSLPGVAPLVFWRTDPLTATAAPHRGQLEVTIENPAGTPFDGRVSTGSKDQAGSSVAISIAKGAKSAVVTLPLPATVHQLMVSANDGAVVAQLDPRRYVPMEGFPTRSGSPSGYHAVLAVDNKPQPPSPLAAVETKPESPAPVALAVGYHFDHGWRYEQAVPDRPAIMPSSARALTLWVRSGPDDDYLRSRFRDQTGQTFQADLGRLGWKGWRSLTIPLDGSGSGAHWGGANDGVPHPPLSWDGLILIDSARRDHPHEGEVLVAAPFYIMSE